MRREEGTKERTAELDQSVESLTHEAASLRRQLEEMTATVAESQSELRAATARAEEAEDYNRRLEVDCERAEREAELGVYRAVAREMQKWEERETRLVKRVDELERGASAMRRSSKTIEEDDPGEKPSYNRYPKSLGTGGCEHVNTRPVDHVDGVEHRPSDNGRPVDNTNTDNARPVDPSPADGQQISTETHSPVRSSVVDSPATLSVHAPVFNPLTSVSTANASVTHPRSAS